MNETTGNTQKVESPLDRLVIFPAQCECGHLYLEKYEWKEVQENGIIGFCWCGFCRTRRNVYPIDRLNITGIRRQNDQHKQRRSLASA